MTEEEIREQVDSTEGFKVLEPTELDLSDVREERVLIPPTNNVKLRVRKATPYSNQENTYRGLNVSFSIVDGISVGEDVKFKNSVVFSRTCYYADPQAYNKDFFKRRQHLVSFTQLMKALGKDISKIQVNDELLKEMEGKEVLGDIRQRANNFTAKDGTEVSTTINDISRFRSVPETAGV